MTDPLRVRAVLFDIDGTLVDSLTAYRVVAERAAAPYGLTISDAVVREALNTTRPFWDLALPPDFADRAETMEKLPSACSAAPATPRCCRRPAPIGWSSRSPC
jgi:FMN phosphatase YigB (HAD superfamily)